MTREQREQHERDAEDAEDTEDGAENLEELDEQTGLPRYLSFTPSVMAMSSGETIRAELEKATRKAHTSNALHAKQVQEDTNLPLFAAVMAHIQNVVVDLVAHNYKITEWMIDQLDVRNPPPVDFEALGLVEDLVLGARGQLDQIKGEVKAALDKMLAAVAEGKPVDPTDLKVLQASFSTRVEHLSADLDNAHGYLALAGSEEEEEEDEDEDGEEEEEEANGEDAEDDVLA